jgi:hypothetical protein
MFAAFVFALTLHAPPQQTVQVPVADPVLPAGPLAAMGATPEGDFYVDVASFNRSDVPDLIRGTAVIVTADASPLQVVRLWINCKNRVYQISNGRRYDASGRQVAATSWVRDQPILADTAADRIAAAFCPAVGPVLEGVTEVADYRAALEVTRAAVAPTP